MFVTIKNGRSVEIRRLHSRDAEALYNYLQSLSPETKSRFGPHPFDKNTVDYICNQTDDPVLPYVAIDPDSAIIIAYMLCRPGLIEWDLKRYERRQQYLDPGSCLSFAPSVADDWQSTGLGLAMTTYLEGQFRTAGIRHIILWGGVQAQNLKAVNFYNKLGYQHMGSFWHEGKDNLDMAKGL